MRTLTEQIHEAHTEVFGAVRTHATMLPVQVIDLAVRAFYEDWEESDLTRAVRKAISLFANPGWIDPNTPEEK